MRVLHVNVSDSFGSRFNGVATREALADRGIEARHLVWHKYTDDDAVVEAFRSSAWRRTSAVLRRAESVLSLQSMLYAQWLTLPAMTEFRDADVVHFHIIHDRYFSLAALPRLSAAKPSVWTFHDPWAMTGHCVYPMDCDRWQIGCGSCPDLALPIPLRRDTTRLNWRYKNWVYSRSNIDVVLASKWMMRFASRSPLAAHFRRHLVPFGVDLARFRPPDDVNAVRARLGIPDGHAVVALRAFESPFKGLGHVRDALRLVATERPLCILTTQSIGEFDEFIGRHHIIELGWVDDDDRMVDFYQAADFLLMPSLAEAFGMMAIEAMACGRPVICYSDTSLPEVTFAPDVGRAVPHGDVRALAAAVEEWVDDVDQVRRRGQRAREIAGTDYGIDLHLDRLGEVYRRAIAANPGSTAA